MAEKRFYTLIPLFLCLICLIYLHENKTADTEIIAASAYNEKRVAITFDDGPHETYTEMLLQGLRERNVKATFFLVGENITGHEDIVKEMYEDGHLIGNHTYSHVILNKVSEDTALYEINRTNELIEKVTGVRTAYIRPPYGGWDESMLYEVDMQPVFWNIDPQDWNTANVAAVVNSVVMNVNDGDIILMHDIFLSSVTASLEIIDILKSQGFIFVTVDEILIS